MVLEIGNKITWASAAGNLVGTIRGIKLSPSAAKTITPWILIDIPAMPEIDRKFTSTTQLCGSDANIKMLKIQRV